MYEEKNKKEKGGKFLPGLKRKAARKVLLAFMVFLAFCVGVSAMIFLSEWKNDGEADAVKGAVKEVQETAAAPEVSASGAILINGKDGKVLYEKEADRKLYPASTTKIMTALLVLEICEELEIGLDSHIIAPEEAEGVEGSSLYLKAGEEISLEELMYGLMLQSGNDAAVALASCVGGTEENFIKRMNEKAKELGCINTHFTNPNGLSDEEHFTTARDLAVIAREAMKKEDFRRIVGAQKWSSEDGGEEKDGDTARTFVNKNKTVFQYEGGNGIKIGYTKASGRTLVASAQREDTYLIAVVLQDSNWFQDAYAMMDFGFALLNQ